jgi:DNA-binding transcriptional MerR regulator
MTSVTGKRAMRRGELAAATGVNPETLRFYEEIGLIGKPSRAANGYRQYPPATVQRLTFIRAIKDLGFTLREIEELLALRAQNAISCRTSAAAAQKKIDEMDAKIAAIRAMRKRLVGFRDKCIEQQNDCCSAFSLIGDE